MHVVFECFVSSTSSVQSVSQVVHITPRELSSIQILESVKLHDSSVVCMCGTYTAAFFIKRGREHAFADARII